MDKKKVVIGMSGGVDSSVSAYLLKKAGYEVLGVTLNHKRNSDLEKEVEAAKGVADFIGIKHIEVDIAEIFEHEVINPFIDGYSKGITPSPCVICDERVKYKILFDIADKYGAYYVATGHYCSVGYNSKYKKYLLKVAKDIKKDQSYMLSRLDTEKLQRLLFPLERYTKSEIREIAKEAKLEVAEKKDSQGICFAKEGYLEFLKKNLDSKIVKGNFVDKNGVILGQHEGYQLYTLGQRRGLNLKKPRPYFIIKINPEKNEIVLGEYEDLTVKEVKLLEYKEAVSLNELQNKVLLGRPRFSSTGALGLLEKRYGEVYFKYLEGNKHSAPGQHLVIYEDGFVLGSGIISY